MIGTTISHYRIIEKLGEGGMGIVYKAHDTSLDRDVALKFLPHHMIASEEEQARFLQEARAAAALNHPHICAIYSIGEEGEQQYIEMEFVDGVTLRRKIEDGELRMEDGIGYAIQVAEALQEAHCHGIVHRDIKADNIMVNGRNQVKVMDFGLAKLKGAVRLTRATTTVGTAAYMSPEQAQGLEVDQRTDIWSLGVLLFEMLTGKLPFRGEHEAALLYSVVHEDPLALSNFRTDISQSVASAVRKALEKDPSERYQSAAELVRDLKGGTTIQGSAEEKSIVVLPFENISPDKDNEYFADGLTEEVIADLSKVRSLKVISRTSAMKLKGTQKDLRSIAGQLGVRYVLEGSVRKAANAIRVTAQLIDAANDAHLWAEKYNGTLENIFEIQETLSRQIVDELKVKLSPEESRRIADRPIKNIQAYEYYMRARREIMLFTKSGVDNAIELLQAALELEGQNELIYFGLGHANWQYVNAGLSPDPAYLAKAQEYLEKIDQISRDSHYGHRLKGALAALRGEIQVSIRELKRAYAVDPNDVETLWMYGGITAMATGNLNVARPVIERLVQLDPLGSINFVIQSFLYLLDGAASDAVRAAEHAVQLEPDSPMTGWILGYTLAADGRREDAYQVLDRLDKMVVGHGNVLVGGLAGGLKHALFAQAEGTVQAMSQEVKDQARLDFQYSQFVAECYALIGHTEESLNWLENAFERGNLNYHYFAEKDPFLVNVRGDERFKKLMVRMKKAWEECEV
jgi:eukaryotic-like serine/threonine-protein kinase